MSAEVGQMKVNGDAESFEGSPSTPINGTMLPNLSKEVFFIGGVPPGFKSGSTKAPGADNAFMGCMKNIFINSDIVDPMSSSHFYGVEQNCPEFITKAGFFGDGYIELKSHSLLKKSNFTFTFNSLQPNALLLMSTCPPPCNSSNSFDARETPGEYSVSLVDGYLTLWLDAGKGRVELKTNQTFNDGEYHVIEVTKNQRRIDFRVDDELYATKNLEKQPYSINMLGEDGGLYLGGVPDFPQNEFLVPTVIRLNGTIRDLVFNNRVISFTDLLEFSKVQIGRSGPKMGTYNGHNQLGKSFEQTSEGCKRVSWFSYFSSYYLCF